MSKSYSVCYEITYNDGSVDDKEIIVKNVDCIRDAVNKLYYRPVEKCPNMRSVRMYEVNEHFPKQTYSDIKNMFEGDDNPFSALFGKFKK